MPVTFLIPLAVVVLVCAFGIIGIVCEMAYERGYDDACADWRSLPSYVDYDVIDAEVVDGPDYRWN